jgi:hypothetical protein
VAERVADFQEILAKKDEAAAAHALMDSTWDSPTFIQMFYLTKM